MTGRNPFSIAVAAVTALVVVVALAVCGCGATGSASGKRITIEQVKLVPSDLGSGWKLEEESSVDASEESSDTTIGLLGGAGASKVLNQVFVKGTDRLQVNLVELGGTGDIDGAVAILDSNAGGNLLVSARSSVTRCGS